jgi:peptidoglycan/LPS O-acetylase OafA/YrhL
MIVVAIVAHLGWFADDFSARCGLVIIGSLIAAAVGFVCVERPVADYGEASQKRGGVGPSPRHESSKRRDGIG